MKILLFIFLFFSGQTYANRILIAAPGIKTESFEKFLRQNPGFQSYTDYILSDSLPKMPAEAILNWAELYLEQNKNISHFHLEFEKARKDFFWNSETRQLMKELLTKLKNKYPRNLEIKNSTCLIQLPENQEECKFQKFSLLLWKQASFPKSRIFIDGIEYQDTDEVYSLLRLKHQILIVSDHHKEILAWLSIDELFARKDSTETLVQGQCQNFSTSKNIDLSIQDRVFVYFAENCVKNEATLHDLQTSKSWYQENKSWVLPVGIVVLGGLLYSLKDQEVQIELPGFSF